MKQHLHMGDQARKLLESGNPGEALALLERSIKGAPRDADSTYLAGICCARLGRHAAAEKYYRRTVKLNKDLFPAYTDLGLLLCSQKKFSEAIRSFKKSLALNAAFAPAHAHIARAYLETQEISKALQHAKKAVGLDGENPLYINLLALCYRHGNQQEKALATLTDLNLAQPQFYGAVHSLYETYRLAGDLASAEKVLLDAKATFSSRPDVYITLGKFYEQSNRAELARMIYREGAANCADNPELLVAHGRVSRTLGDFDEGLAKIEQALGIDAMYQPALVERANCHILKGEYDAAFALLDTFVSSQAAAIVTPGLALAYAQACRLTGRCDESVSTLQKTLKARGIPDDMKSVALFSMGDSYDKMQRYDAAFAQYRKANTAAAYTTDINRHLQVLDDICSGIGSDATNSATHSDCTSSKPVFIVGMPRSGTSLAEQIIASHPDAYGAGEITELWSIGREMCNSKHLQNYSEHLRALSRESANEFADRYLAFIEQLAPDALRITDKLPHNFMQIGLIRQLFPQARIIHCHRHPFDTCLSIYFKRFNDDHLYARNLADIAKFYAKYSELMARWMESGSAIFSLRYEDLVANQEEVTRALIQHTGLEWNDKCLAPHASERVITTLSYSQANQPIYTDARYRWKHYRRHLQPLIDILGDPDEYS
jgi:tetratricopeptide (TPR) repeat protein